MIFGMTYYRVCWYFLCYSFLGWVLEVVFHAVTQGKVVNRGFLNGPVCPIYGFGVLSIFSLTGYLDQSGMQINDFYLFMAGMILSTTIELIAGWMMDRCFHAKWWDYSKRPFNFRGYICLEFSMIWGACVLLVVRVMQIYVKNHELIRSESKYGWYLLLALYAIYLSDVIVTVLTIRGFNRNLRQLDGIQKDMRFISDHLSKQVGEKTLSAMQMVEDSQEKLQSKHRALQKKIDELSEEIGRHTIFGQGRLLNAFPSIMHRDYQEALKMLKQRESCRFYSRK